MKILVTGAAGFIGSVVAEHLLDAGHAVVALDNLRHGRREAVDARARLHEVDLRDRAALTAVFRAERVDAVVHLAAESLVSVSMRDPGRFYDANVCGGIALLDAMVETGVARIVVSSTAAVYGEPAAMPIVEDVAGEPVNPYGDSKLAFERALGWYRRAHGLRSVTLRYFNACGATVRHGEYHVPETHLIPIVLDVALGGRESVSLFGNDYDTPDGTCVRDYVHVSDIAGAHLLGLDAIDRLGARTYNLGSGVGHTNRQVVEAVRRVTGRAIRVIEAPRRAGDPSRLLASPARIQEELGWRPIHRELEAMIESAWAWRRAHPAGYGA
jgi:UDP-glucose 4-epimerase